MCKEDIIRIKKGMVFWCDFNEDIDKYNVPDLENDRGYSVKDRVLYGRRPWLVVSDNDNNKTDTLCTVVPFSRSGDPTLPYHIPVKGYGADSVICVEQVKTVNSRMLTEYYFSVNEHIMGKVENTLIKYLGLPVQNLWQGIGIKDALDRVEALIGGIIDREKEKRSFSEDDVEYLVRGVLNKLQELDNVKDTQHMDIDLSNKRVQDFYQKYPQVYQKDLSNGTISGSSEEPVKVVVRDGKKINWTSDKCREFLNDCDTMGFDELSVKWNLKTKKAFWQRKNYVKKFLSREG